MRLEENWKAGKRNSANWKARGKSEERNSAKL